MLVVYKEVSPRDGFVITAFTSRRVNRENDRMANRIVVPEVVQDLLAAVPHLVRLTSHKLWVDYDSEADVLYLSLQRPQRATDNRYVDDEGVILSYRGKELVGITVLDASKRGAAVAGG